MDTVATPVADWLSEHWTPDLFLRDELVFKGAGKIRYCVVGALEQLPLAMGISLPSWPSWPLRHMDNGALYALTHWNNRHSREAAIAAVAIHERTRHMPVCPDQDCHTWRDGRKIPVYETYREHGLCPSHDAMPAATHQEGSEP